MKITRKTTTAYSIPGLQFAFPVEVEQVYIQADGFRVSYAALTDQPLPGNIQYPVTEVQISLDLVGLTSMRVNVQEHLSHKVLERLQPLLDKLL